MNNKIQFQEGVQFNAPRIDPKVLHEQQHSPLPYWVKCKICKKGPLADNWLKAVSTDPECKVYIHIGCISKD